MAATHVGRARSAQKLFGDAIKRRQPGCQQIGVVAGAEETLRAVKQAFVMLAPFHAFAGAEIV